MLEARFVKHILNFKEPGGTSRGVLNQKQSWYIIVNTNDNEPLTGIGECSIIKGLSIDDVSMMDTKLKEVCSSINNWEYWLEEGLIDFPAIRFGLETAIKDIVEGGNRIIFPSEFTNGKGSIPINGLVWMGNFNEMKSRITQKIEQGFNCIKIKVGAISFDEELQLLKLIRSEFNSNDLELRVDANGAFHKNDALEKLNRLSEFTIHSIEQPIMPEQWEPMAELCEKSPIPIALDEELIGITQSKNIGAMFDTISPQFIILKPSLLGGFAQSSLFIREAENRNIGWWVTSALEGNVGLNAIAQWTYILNNNMYQGLGTGQLFTNNIPSPLYIQNAHLHFNQLNQWDLTDIVDEK